MNPITVETSLSGRWQCGYMRNLLSRSVMMAEVRRHVAMSEVGNLPRQFLTQNRRIAGE